MKKTIQFFIFIFLSMYYFQIFPQKMVVCMPIADLRIKPIESPITSSGLILSKDNPLQDSQLLLNERIFFIKERGDWIKVMSVEQPKFILGKGWTGQTGWIKKKQAIPVKEFPKYDLVVKEHNAKIITNSVKFIPVSIGTKFKKKAKIYIDSYFISLPGGNDGTIDLDFIKELKIPKDEQFLRQNMLATAKSFLNTPYSWGGRSSFDTNAKMQTGVDCSGFINLIHRVYGMDIPRDAHDQYMLSTLMNGKNAQPGDLIFSGKEIEPGKSLSKRINHVMMYLGDDLLIESTGKPPFKNRIISTQEKFGKPTHEIKNGEKIGKNIIQFGTFVGVFPEEFCRTITTS